jgi:excisionase family DNA binding protein
MSTEHESAPGLRASELRRRIPREGGSLRPLLTIEQLAGALAVSPKTVRRLVAHGFPHIRFGRVLRFDPVDVQRWLEARRS